MKRAPFDTLEAKSISHTSSLSQLLGIDYRALGAFRVGMASLVLYDLFARTLDIDAFYTDTGVLPRSLLQIPRFRFSFHALAGDRMGEEALFFVGAVFAFLLLIGAWTRLAAFASWVFLSSLDARNPLVLNHGDELLRIFLFWSMFVPLSPDAGSGRTGKRHLSVFTAALTIQACLVYFFGALLKTDLSWRVTGTAIQAALGLEQLSTGLGRALLDWPHLLTIVTLCVYYLELLGPLLVFVPWENRRNREITIMAFVAVHLGIAATMNLGLFPWVSILGWVLILPSETLDLFQRALKMRPAPLAPRKAEGKKAGEPLRLALQVLGAYLLCTVLIWNFRTLNQGAEELKPTPFEFPLLLAQLDQRWNMFAPKPNYISGWYAARADLANGSQVDAMRAGRAFTWKRPEVISATYPDFRWRKYLINLSLPRFERYRRGLPAFLRWRWDRAHPGGPRIARLTVYFISQNLSVAGGMTPLVTAIAAD